MGKFVSEIVHRDIFTSEQLDKIPVDNKVGENYFGEMAVQLRKKVASFKAIRERLVLSSNADLAFSVGAEKCWQIRS